MVIKNNLSLLLFYFSFVTRIYDHFKDHFNHKREKIPNPISGLTGVYALRRFS